MVIEGVIGFKFIRFLFEILLGKEAGWSKERLFCKKESVRYVAILFGAVISVGIFCIVYGIEY